MERRFFKGLTVLISAILCATVFGGCKGNEDENLDENKNVYESNFTYAAAQPDSPLRGLVVWNTAALQPFPYSTEYLPVLLNTVVDENGNFDFSSADQKLNAIAKRGNHAVLRFNIWDPPTVALPQYYLLSGVGTVDIGGTAVPDFSGERLIELLCDFIRALGEHYDGDPRIGFLQLGLLGRWGEWNYGGDYPAAKIPSFGQYNRIYEAFDNAFDITKLQARNPNLGSPKNYAIGYHDDNFMFSTLGSGGGDFKYLCRQGGIGTDLYKTQSFGAELSGYENGDFFSTEEKRERFAESVRYQNFSFMLWQKYDTVIDTPIWQQHKETAIELTRLFGYELHVKSLALKEENGENTLYVQIQNTGNAPFYYDWDGLAELYADGEQIVSKTKKLELSQIMPSETKSFAIQTGLPAGRTVDSVFFSLVNPLCGISENAKPFRFANQTADLENGRLKLEIKT